MTKIYALLLLPIAYAGAFTTFPIVEPAFRPKTWQDVLIMFVLLGPAYAYLLAAIAWILRSNSDEAGSNSSKVLSLLLVFVAYFAGAGSVILLANV